MKARVTVTLKNGVLDPQGKAIEGALASLNFSGVNEIRQGKVFDIDVDAANEADATKQMKAMCEALLANMVIEDYEFDWVQA